MRGDNLRTVFYRSRSGDAEKSAVLPRVSGLVIDSGFDEFIRSNWGALMGGGALPMPFLVPSRLKDLSFQVQHVRGEMQAGVAAEVFRLKLSGIASWVAPHIDVSYSVDQHLLMRYQGPSDLRDASGANLHADIIFKPADRQPAGADAVSAAKLAPLAPCRG